MEDKTAKELLSKINQYELLVDFLTAAHKYSGVLTTDHILVALGTAAGVLGQDLDADTPGDVEDSQQRMKLQLDYQTPHAPASGTPTGDHVSPHTRSRK